MNNFSFSLCVSFGFLWISALLLPPSIWLYAETLKTTVMFLWMLTDIISHSILPIKKSKGEIVSVNGD